MRWTKPSFFLPQFHWPLAKPSNGSFVLGFSPLLTYPEIKKKCGFSTGGVESAEKKTFWGFLGPFYQLFFFFCLESTTVLVHTSILASSLPFPGMNARVLLKIDFRAGGRGFYRRPTHFWGFLRV
jgi:hypothetical protein